jgi:hypothetical protein
MPDVASSVRTPSKTSYWTLFLYAAFAVLGSVALVNLIVMETIRPAITIIVSLSLIGLAFLNIRLSIAATLVYLVFLGDLRRMLIPIAGWSGTDPLLLIGPVVAICLFGYAWASGALSLNTSLAKWTVVLMGIMVLQVFNPRQGGMIVGVTGVMFMLVPLLWYWIGRAYATPDYMRTLLYWVVIPLTVVVMLMGYYQIFYGYLPYQLEWFNIAGYNALGSPETGLAPISLFASSTEHNAFLTVGLAILWASVLQKRWNVALLLPIMFMAVFLSGTRGPVVKFIVIAAVLWAVLGDSTRSWTVRGVFALLIAGLGFVWSLSQVGPGSGGPSYGELSGVERKMARQSELLGSHNRQGGTLRVHSFMMLNGYIDAVRNPLGAGLGATTKAAHKFTGRSVTTEADMTDVARATGLFGGIAYHVMMFYIIVSAFQYWQRTRSTLALSLIGILGVSGLQWLAGGLYALCPLIWLCIGALDRFQNMPDAEVT